MKRRDFIRALAIGVTISVTPLPISAREKPLITEIIIKGGLNNELGQYWARLSCSVDGREMHAMVYGDESEGASVFVKTAARSLNATLSHYGDYEPVTAGDISSSMNPWTVKYREEYLRAFDGLEITL